MINRELKKHQIEKIERAGLPANKLQILNKYGSFYLVDNKNDLSTTYVGQINDDDSILVYKREKKKIKDGYFITSKSLIARNYNGYDFEATLYADNDEDLSKNITLEFMGLNINYVAQSVSERYPDYLFKAFYNVDSFESTETKDYRKKQNNNFQKIKSIFVK